MHNGYTTHGQHLKAYSRAVPPVTQGTIINNLRVIGIDTKYLNCTICACDLSYSYSRVGLPDAVFFHTQFTLPFPYRLKPTF